MLEVNGTEVKISRGDSARIVIELDTAPAEGTETLITMKRRPGTEQEALWEKRIAVDGARIALELESADTDQRPGVYWWDVRLVNGDSVQTLFLPSAFEVLEVVGSV